jgi:hypothetical protein
LPTAPPPVTEFRPRLRASLADCEIAVWCIEDLMDPSLDGMSSSNTGEKDRVLKLLFASERARGEITLVVAFGTAATPHSQSYNGCVFLGRNVFNHDPEPAGSPSRWHPADLIDRVLPSAFPADAFRKLQPFSSPIPDINARMLRPYGAPASDIVLIPTESGVAVSSVNVVDYKLYSKTDPEALEAAAAAGVRMIASLESTHGVIRAQSDAPFLFISGITNRVGAFAYESQNHPYTQNFVAAHNAGVSMVWLLDWAINGVS